MKIFPDAVSEGIVKFGKPRPEGMKFQNLTRDNLIVCRNITREDGSAANVALQYKLWTI